jgi:uncharacterized protein YndB with AHSA1/START domain
MSQSIEKVFTVAVPPARAWQMFADGTERARWEATTYDIEPVTGGSYHWTIGDDIAATGEVLEAVPETLMRQRDHAGPHAGSVVTITFESVTSGTRISITHAGFGDDDSWDEWLEGTSLGWDRAIADLVAYLETGVVAGRFSIPLDNPGMRTSETPAGLVVDRIAVEGFAHQAGIAAGDLLLTIGGVPVYANGELWTIVQLSSTRMEPLEVEFVHDGERRSGRGSFGTVEWDAPELV